MLLQDDFALRSMSEITARGVPRLSPKNGHPIRVVASAGRLMHCR